MIPSEMIVLFLTVFSVMAGMSVIGPVLPSFALTFGVSYTMVGFAMSAFPLARIFSNIPAGFLADRIGKKKPLIIGVLIASVGSFLVGISSDIYRMIAFRFISGIGSAIFVTVAMTYMTHLAPKDGTAKYLSYYQSAFQAGTITGPVLGGFIAEIGGIRAPFFVLSFITLLCAFFIFSVVKEHKNKVRSERETIKMFKLMSDPRLIGIEISQLIVFLTFAGIRTTMLPIYGIQSLFLSFIQIGIVLAIAGVVNIISMSYLSNYVDKISRKFMIVTGFLVLAFGVFSFVFAKDFFGLLYSGMLLGLAQSLINPSTAALVTDISKPSERGLTIGAYRTAGDIGFLIGAPTVGILVDNVSINSPFYVVSALCMLTAVLLTFVLRRGVK